VREFVYTRKKSEEGAGDTETGVVVAEGNAEDG
jgi:hypothetical protein